jgi:UDP-3-O-[3-hydroxymyristoyl] glucosamine N-acyltransferase
MNARGQLTSADCADFLGLTLHGGVVNIARVAGLSENCEAALKFVSVFQGRYLEQLNKNPNNFVIAHTDYAGYLSLPHVLSSNPRLDFCRLSGRFFPNMRSAGIEPSASFGINVIIGADTYIGHNVVIEDGVQIGDGSKILHNVVISEGCQIGSNCLIKSGTVIGQRGFGFERDVNGIPIEFPHYGKVVIGDYVEIGALNTIVAGALSDTVIEDHVKTDDHVHIAHNVRIRWGAFITACAEISGSVDIGEQAWVGPNCSVIDKASIGAKSFVGIGAVITKSVPENVVVAGNPGKVLRAIES